MLCGADCAVRVAECSPPLTRHHCWPHHARPTRWCIQHRGVPWGRISEGPLLFLVAALTLVVVAVPEGLPLASTMALACSVQALKRNHVRVSCGQHTSGSVHSASCKTRRRVKPWAE